MDKTCFLNEIHSIPWNFPSTIVFFSLTGRIGLSMQTLKKQDWTAFSKRNNVYNAKFSLKTRLEHGFGIEYMYFQWL